MIYRRDLIEHFDWLAESKYLEEFCDEALVAISMTAYGHGRDFVMFGPTWMAADHFVDRYGLRDFVDRVLEEDPMISEMNRGRHERRADGVSFTDQRKSKGTD